MTEHRPPFKQSGYRLTTTQTLCYNITAATNLAMVQKSFILLLKVLVPVISLLLGGVYIWKTQMSHNQPKALPSSKNMRQVLSIEDQYFLENNTEKMTSTLNEEQTDPIHEYDLIEKQMEAEQAAINAERLLMPSSKSIRLAMPSSKSAMINPIVINPLGEKSDEENQPTETIEPAQTTP
ncbi:MAG: hypothetical protein ACSHX8_06625 [Opitutaceae bacterium]